MKKLYPYFLFALLSLAVVPVRAITVAEALAIGQQLAVGSTTSETYTIEGYVNVITQNAFNESYNNMTFWIADTKGAKSSTAAGALQVYRGRPEVELQKGDKISVTANIKRFNSSTIETDPMNAPVTLLEREDIEPEPEPAIVTGSLRVCAQNLENYYYNSDYTSRADYNTPAGFAAKTRKIVNAMLDIDADIYAFCEVEAKPIVLKQLADSMSARAGVPGLYAAAKDDFIDYTLGDGDDNHIKSGFIYRTDRIETVGTNHAASPGSGYYSKTMRYQVFRQKSTEGKLLVNMNHFKAFADGASQRITNASNLVNAMNSATGDPDFLLLGDMNCEYGEDPMNILLNAGYQEQLLRFNPNAYSYCHNGLSLIDHVWANASMSAQIVSAYVKHICTSDCTPGLYYADVYSDHDPCVVEIELNEAKTAIEDVYQQQSAVSKMLLNGQIVIIMPDGKAYSLMGQPLQ